MRDSLQKAASTPYFKLAVDVGLQNLISAAQVFSSVGIDISTHITGALQAIHSQLSDAAYEVTDLDELIEQAQAIGDSKVVTQEKEIRPPREDGETFGATES